MVVIYFVDFHRALGPLYRGARNGLTIWETAWDHDIFWGELWFNLLVAMLLYVFLLVTCPPDEPGTMRLDRHQQRAIARGAVLVVGGLLGLMALTPPSARGLATNWYPTHFAYQLLAWPAIIGFAGLLFTKLRKDGRGIKGKRKDASTAPTWHWLVPVTCLGMAGIWTYLVLVTQFHPHALLSFGQATYTLLMTIGFPISLAGFVLAQWLPREETRHPAPSTKGEAKQGVSNRREHRDHRGLAWAGVFAGGLGLFVLVQVAGAFTVPVAGADDVFSMRLVSWWPLAHWPGWLFAGALGFGLYFYTRLRVSTPPASRSDERAPERSPKPTGPPARAPGRRPLAALTSPRGKAVFLLVLVGSLAALTGGSVAAEVADDDSPRLLVNQVGYLPTGLKRVVFQAPKGRGVPGAAEFEVVNASDGRVVHAGTLARNESRYQHWYMNGNFTAFQAPGTYYLRARVPGFPGGGGIPASPATTARSHHFAIADDVYNEAVHRVQQFFYYQRCGYAVEEIVPGYPGHAACHLTDGEVWTGSTWAYKNLTGGWHDAGDYNKYNGWFQTQWFCVEALADAAWKDPGGFFSDLPSQYDSVWFDAIEEALWGTAFMVKMTDEVGLHANATPYLVLDSLCGYDHAEERHALMSYWGPPEQDWTTPRRIRTGHSAAQHAEWNPGIPWGYVGYARGYNYAGTLLQVARLLDLYAEGYPLAALPSWAPNSTGLRALGHAIYQTYAALQEAHGVASALETYTGLFHYAREWGYEHEANWTRVDALVPAILPLLNANQTYPYWFAWSSAYMMGQIVDHYLETGRPLPANVTRVARAFQAGHFTSAYVGPFGVEHVIGHDGQWRLFEGAERATSLLLNAWLQALLSRAAPDAARPDLLQAQLDWMFGLNPVDLCQVESVGAVNVPQYHHRYAWARNPRGAVPGAIVNGPWHVTVSKDYARGWIARTGSSLDVGDRWQILPEEAQYASWPGNPLLRDGVPSQTNEVWIPHNAAFLKFATSLMEFGWI